MSDPRKSKNRGGSKTVVWVCDNKDCYHTNSRRLRVSDVLNDDVCEKCKKRIHEPLTKTIKIEQ